MDDIIRRPRRPKINLSQGSHPGTWRPTPRQTQPVRFTPRQHIAAPVLARTPAAPSTSVKATKPKAPVAAPPPAPKKRKLWRPSNRKQWIIFIAAAVLILGGGGAAAYWFLIRKPAPPVAVMEPEPEPEPEPVPTTEPSKLSGREVEFAINDRPVYAVQIENSPEARPQSGLREADIVFEAVAEGGITRFNALFHDSIPPNIGPVRSLRPYYIDWFWPFDAAIVHAGGSPEALNDVRTLGLKDLDHGGNGSSFRRVTNRYAPHNLYTTGSTILDLMTKKGFTSSTFTSLERKAVTPEAPANATTINLKISSALYNVSYTYDKATNSYKRSQGGTPHLDAESGEQLRPNVLIVPVMTKGIHADRSHTVYGTVGSGKVFIFQDGAVTEGTWAKSERKAQWKLTDAAGKSIPLNAGQTWFTMIDAAGSVTYSP